MVETLTVWIIVQGPRPFFCIWISTVGAVLAVADCENVAGRAPPQISVLAPALTVVCGSQTGSRYADSVAFGCPVDVYRPLLKPGVGLAG